MWPGVLKESLSEDVPTPGSFPCSAGTPPPPTALISGMANLANRSITGRKITFPPGPKSTPVVHLLRRPFSFLPFLLLNDF